MKRFFAACLIAFTLGEPDPATLVAPIEIITRDAGGKSTTLLLGYHEQATIGYDIALGENPVPPIPFPQAYDMRFLAPPGRTLVPPTGSYVDVRPITALRDTFVIRYQPENGRYPVTLSWSQDDIAAYDTAEMILMDPLQEQSVDMKTESTFVVSDAVLPQVMLILQRRAESTGETIRTREKGEE